VRRNAKRILLSEQSALQSPYSNPPDFRQIRGRLKIRIAPLSCLSNGE